MKIGIAYDTLDKYGLDIENTLHFDFAELSSIHILKESIESLGYQVELLGNTSDVLQQIINKSFSCDLVYNTVEGLRSRNREGLLPSLLELCGIPYIGTDAFGLSLTLDKTLTKTLAKRHGILTPNFYTAIPSISEELLSRKLSALNFPLILKPNFEGNSSGIVVCDTLVEACSATLSMCRQYQSPILCEEFVLGKEITVPLIGNSSTNMLYGITTVNIQKNDNFWLDVNAKMFGDYHNTLLQLPDQISEQYRDICTKLFIEIGCHDFARFDFRMTKDNQIYFIEVNPLPALFPGGSFDIVGRQNGYSFAQTIEIIISVACDRYSIPKI